MYLDFKVGKANGSAWVDLDPDDPTVGYYGQTTFHQIIINNKHLGGKYNARLERIMLNALREDLEEARESYLFGISGTDGVLKGISKCK